ncbi:hypothetical protein P3W85_02230 [Cupriavidus basilensis]|uniref:Uncharacterized protein n=1 Tax=Cupriavidus basilensis TaxID=68895 RepID=A0ABT6AGQ6_9BURK|nr:hypothetical protein [Cupriavidus basilensis]MDF3831782.1 hypothetical protein [Cupriavidus basilensis]
MERGDALAASSLPDEPVILAFFSFVAGIDLGESYREGVFALSLTSSASHAARHALQVEGGVSLAQ